MTRAACLVVVSFLAALPAQYDPKAPEPIHRFKGTLILSAGQAIPAAAAQAFQQLAGESVLNLREGVEPGEALQSSTAIFIHWKEPKAFAEKYRGTAVEARLRELVQKGGVIGAHGPVVAALTKATLDGDWQGLDVVPGAILAARYTETIRLGTAPSEAVRTRLLNQVSKHPTLVGLGIEANSALVIHERWLDVIGAGSVHAVVAASARRPLRIDKMNRNDSPQSQIEALKRRGRTPRSRDRSRNRSRNRSRRGGGRDNTAFRPRRLGDLIALGRAAQARVAKRFPAWTPAAPNVPKGTLIIIGGGGMPKGLMDKFIELAGGKDAPLLYIPCEEREQVRGTPRILASWKRMGCTNVDFIHTKDRHKANHDKELLAKLRKAKGIFLGGGRQWNFVDSYQNTMAHKLMHDVLARGGVICGSSAGASIQAAYMVRGNSLGNFDAMAEGYETGLGFITGIAIDQHFSQRGRLPDMTHLVDTYPELLGVGLDEASSIVVRGSIAEAFSRKGRFVHLYDRTKPVVKGKPDYLRLAHGQKFDLKARKILVPPEPVEKPKPKAATKKK